MAGGARDTCSWLQPVHCTVPNDRAAAPTARHACTVAARPHPAHDLRTHAANVRPTRSAHPIWRSQKRGYQPFMKSTNGQPRRYDDQTEAVTEPKGRAGHSAVWHGRLDGHNPKAAIARNESKCTSAIQLNVNCQMSPSLRAEAASPIRSQVRALFSHRTPMQACVPWTTKYQRTTVSSHTPKWSRRSRDHAQLHSHCCTQTPSASSAEHNMRACSLTARKHPKQLKTHPYHPSRSTPCTPGLLPTPCAAHPGPSHDRRHAAHHTSGAWPGHDPASPSLSGACAAAGW